MTTKEVKLQLVKKNLANARRQRTIILKAFKKLGDIPGGRKLTSLNDYIDRLEKAKKYWEKRV